jgi:hypothetical protein
MLVRLPVVVRDLSWCPAAQEHREFGGRTRDALAEFRRTSVLWRGVQRCWDWYCAQEREHWAHLVVHDHRVPGGAAGAGQDDRPGDQ